MIGVLGAWYVLVVWYSQYLCHRPNPLNGFDRTQMILYVHFSLSLYEVIVLECTMQTFCTKPYATYFGFSTTKLNTNNAILSNQYNMTLMRSQLFVEKFVVQANLILKQLISTPTIQ